MSPAARPIQIFGRRDSRNTQRAVRYFKERRVPLSFVDIAIHPPAAGELRRFRERFGAQALVDAASTSFRDGGLAYLRMDDEEMYQRVLADPRLLVVPLVRLGNDLAIGFDEVAWKRLAAAALA